MLIFSLNCLFAKLILIVYPENTISNQSTRTENPDLKTIYERFLQATEKNAFMLSKL